MKAYWAIYLAVVICYKAFASNYLRTITNYSFNFIDALYAVFFIGLFGFSFNRCILTKKIWRYIFFILIILYFHTWIVMPLHYFWGSKIAISHIFSMIIFNIPLLPLLYALYSYAWKSEALWDKK